MIFITLIIPISLFKIEIREIIIIKFLFFFEKYIAGFWLV